MTMLTSEVREKVRAWLMESNEEYIREHAYDVESLVEMLISQCNEGVVGIWHMTDEQIIRRLFEEKYNTWGGHWEKHPPTWGDTSEERGSQTARPSGLRRIHPCAAGGERP